VVDASRDARDDRRMDEDLDAREAARIRRRDHDTDAERRDLMRPGMGKVFKQITDSWDEKASEHESRAQKKAGRSSRPR
jgi:hypothetical protein